MEWPREPRGTSQKEIRIKKSWAQNQDAVRGSLTSSFFKMPTLSITCTAPSSLVFLLNVFCDNCRFTIIMEIRGPFPFTQFPPSSTTLRNYSIMYHNQDVPTYLHSLMICRVCVHQSQYQTVPTQGPSGCPFTATPTSPVWVPSLPLAMTIFSTFVFCHFNDVTEKDTGMSPPRTLLTLSVTPPRLILLRAPWQTQAMLWPTTC